MTKWLVSLQLILQMKDKLWYAFNQIEKREQVYVGKTTGKEREREKTNQNRDFTQWAVQTHKLLSDHQDMSSSDLNYTCVSH